MLVQAERVGAPSETLSAILSILVSPAMGTCHLDADAQLAAVRLLSGQRLSVAEQIHCCSLLLSNVRGFRQRGQLDSFSKGILETNGRLLLDSICSLADETSNATLVELSVALGHEILAADETSGAILSSFLLRCAKRTCLPDEGCETSVTLIPVRRPTCLLRRCWYLRALALLPAPDCRTTTESFVVSLENSAVPPHYTAELEVGSMEVWSNLFVAVVLGLPGCSLEAGDSLAVLVRMCRLQRKSGVLLRHARDDALLCCFSTCVCPCTSSKLTRLRLCDELVDAGVSSTTDIGGETISCVREVLARRLCTVRPVRPPLSRLSAYLQEGGHRRMAVVEAQLTLFAQRVEPGAGLQGVHGQESLDDFEPSDAGGSAEDSDEGDWRILEQGE